jgi:hypothetical protein
MNWIGDIPRELAERIACDATLYRIVLDPDGGLPMDVGRAYRSAPDWMRKVLCHRDRGCRFPGCDMSVAWSDTHHLDHWARGGITATETMILLCRRHHRAVHEGGWTIRFDPATGEVRVWRPDGSPYEIGPSQPYISPNTKRQPRHHDE